MSLATFQFSRRNLTGTAHHLQSQRGSPFTGDTIVEIEDKLVTAAIDLFKSRLKNEETVNAELFERGELHASLLWKGTGAIFSAKEAYGGGVRSQTVDVDMPNLDVSSVYVSLWAYLDA